MGSITVSTSSKAKSGSRDSLRRLLRPEEAGGEREGPERTRHPNKAAEQASHGQVVRAVVVQQVAGQLRQPRRVTSTWGS